MVIIPLIKKSIITPINHIVLDIFCYPIHFHLVSDYMIMESRLPRKRDMVFICKPCDSPLKSRNQMR